MDEIGRKMAGSRVLAAVGEIERERKAAGNPLLYAVTVELSHRTGFPLRDVRDVVGDLKELGYVTTGETLNDIWVRLRV